MENRRIAITDPGGVWNQDDLIGASVHIKSLAVSGFFAFDDTATYIIEDIRFRVNSYGKCVASIYLEGIKRPFAWKDLEIVGLDLAIYPDAICGTFCCGGTLCGYGLDNTIYIIEGDGRELDNPREIIIDGGDGPELD